MNQVLAGTSAVIITILLWSTRKKPKGLLSDSQVYKANLYNLNQSAVTLVEPRGFTTEGKKEESSEEANKWNKPISTKDQIKLKKQILKAINSGPEERLEAVRLANAWGSPSIVPVLKKGLKDADSRVVIAAAAAISQHRGATRKPITQASRPPRNVSLIR